MSSFYEDDSEDFGDEFEMFKTMTIKEIKAFLKEQDWPDEEIKKMMNDPNFKNEMKKIGNPYYQDKSIETSGREIKESRDVETRDRIQKENLFFNLNEKLEKMKIINIETNKSEYPTLKLTIMYEKDSIILDVDNAFIFGSAVGKISSIRRFPFFVCNVSLSEIEKLIHRISDKTLLEGIKIINTLYKKKDITTLDQIEGFKNYISSARFFKKISYDFYFNCLKKLVFFSESLFKEVLGETLKTKNPIDGRNDIDLMTIDDYTRKNISTVRDLLLSQESDKYLISEVVSDTSNLYQIENGVIRIEDSNSFSEYKKDYGSNLRKVQDFIRTKQKTGNFYIIIKKDKLYGSFNNFALCKLVDKKKIPQDGLVSLTCVSRKTKIKTYFTKIKGGKRKTKRRRKR